MLGGIDDPHPALSEEFGEPIFAVDDVAHFRQRELLSPWTSPRMKVVETSS